MIYLTLFWEFFKVGLFTFGGGYAMIPLVKELVLNFKWLTENEFFEFIGVCESTPGPIAVNMATYVGSMQAGFWGSVMATLGVVLPSFIIILLIAAIIKNFISNKYFQGFIGGVNPVVISLIISTGIVFLFKAIGYVSLTEFNFNLVSLIVLCAITAIYFLVKLIWHKKMPASLVILTSAVLGIGISVLANLF